MTAAPFSVSSFVTGDVCAEVLAGLRSSPKTLPPKLFYDEAGADLFQQICELPEYYLTRSELSILNERAGEIAHAIGPRAALIEYGSGAGQKIRLLLDALENPVAYVPVDISGEQLAGVSETIAAQYPDIEVMPVCADYTSRFDLPALPEKTRRRVAFFPGSTIGNFDPVQAASFLSRIRSLIGSSGMLVLGVDRVKAKAVLDAAYDDRAGVTAAFNLNILHRIARETGSSIDVGSFRHVAFFNEGESRIEMHLESRADQTIEIAGQPIHFTRGETIWTESSWKYSEAALQSLVSSSGFSLHRLWTDRDENFWVAILVPRCDCSDQG
jgi:dimethylhistidine N-methyltransferase